MLPESSCFISNGVKELSNRCDEDLIAPVIKSFFCPSWFACVFYNRFRSGFIVAVKYCRALGTNVLIAGELLPNFIFIVL